jgi:uncharacterized membrane protein YebE (DUF533 family)
MVRSALGRDEPEPAPAAPGDPGPTPVAAPEAASSAPEEEGEPAFDPGIVGVLGEKVLLAWLRNRHQLLFPFALDLHRLDASRAELVVNAMIAAAEADGSFDAKERERLAGIVRLVDPGGGFDLDGAVAARRSLNETLAQVRDVQTGALVYAASLMAVDQRKPVNRFYLRYLAARLQLSDELVASLEQRYRSSS